MPGLGTIVNTAAIIIGGITGYFAKKLLNDRIQKILLLAMALSVLMMGINGAVSKSLQITDGAVTITGNYMVIFSLVLGGLVGEIIDADGKMEKFGAYLKKRSGNEKDSAFISGFLNASFTVCIGAMAVMGSLMDGIFHDHSILFTKAVLDFVIIMVMTASMGKGCIFSAIPVFIFQGIITLLSSFISPVLNDAAMNNLSLVGSILIMCIGINLLFDGRFSIKVANLLPSIVFAVIAAYIPFLNI
ncbi:MAG: DUF554 domain-containing protein [Eubacteriales bacterium]|nr:DUF554 domain-containing protein [Eubacteriales bacterium]